MDAELDPQGAPEPTAEPAAAPHEDAPAERTSTAERLPSTARFEVTLDEFCNHRLGKDPRHELIGGFRFVERQAGRLKDTIAAFADRFDAFAAPAADASAPKN